MKLLLALLLALLAVPQASALPWPSLEPLDDSTYGCYGPLFDEAELRRYQVGRLGRGELPYPTPRLLPPDVPVATLNAVYADGRRQLDVPGYVLLGSVCHKDHLVEEAIEIWRPFGRAVGEAADPIISPLVVPVIDAVVEIYCKGRSCESSDSG